jgi:hypothetical protein
MMKKYLIIVFLSIHAIHAMAQKNYIKIGGGIGSAPYEGGLGWNVDFQYEYKLAKKLSGFMSVGIIGDELTSQGRSQGSDGTQTWDNSWKYQYSERLNYIDLGLRHRILKKSEKYEMKAALGASFAQSVFRYPENIYINRGIIEQQDNVTRKVEVIMLLLGIENHIPISDHVSINLNLNYRTAFKERHELRREVRFDDGISTATSGILSVVNVSLQVGYLF